MLTAASRFCLVVAFAFSQSKPAPVLSRPWMFWHAERDISKGEQLLHTYGDLSDAQLLQTYGFVEEIEDGFDNPHNFVPVLSALVLQSCQEAISAGEEVSWWV